MRNVPAYQLSSGMVRADGRIIDYIFMTEKNEWLTVHVDYVNGASSSHDFYENIQIKD